jgi:hypothetical protein
MCNSSNGRHCSAAVDSRALGGTASIVTWNQADFRAAALATYAVRACTPDEHLCGLLDVWPAEITGT